MNIFNILGAYLKGENNFSLISKRITLIYYILERNHKDSFSNDTDLFQRCGEIALHIYISEGTISVEDIKQSITLAQIGQCSIFPVSRSHTTTAELFSNKSRRHILTNFILQLLCLVFHADNAEISVEDIIAAVIHKKKTIEKCIKETGSHLEDIMNSKYGKETIITVNFGMSLRKGA